MVETVLQILFYSPEACILLCAPSNPATDTLVSRLKFALKPHEMLRLNDPTRTFAEVALNIRQYCCIYTTLTPWCTRLTIYLVVDKDRYALPPWEVLMRYRVVVCSCIEAAILVDAHCTNSALARLETEIVGSLHPHRHKEPIMPHWTHLLIDEVRHPARHDAGINGI
jgi:hypothetical protein